jgi:hypothetical protein
MAKPAKREQEVERTEAADREGELQRLAARHLRFGWWALLVFLSLGIALELLHGFKVSWYLDQDQTTRRHMWTLAHAHGTLLALIHLAFAASIPRLQERDARWRQIASPCLYSATLTLPAGFFLGGAFIYSGDPGMGILLVPVGAFLLLIAVWLIALGVKRSS